VALFIPLQVSRTAPGRIDTKKRLFLRCEHRLHVLLHLLRRNVFLVFLTGMRVNRIFAMRK
jgi:hypothetical protein